VSDVQRQYSNGIIPGHAVTNYVQTGLTNFIRAAGRRLDAFSYAFTPSEPDEIIATNRLSEHSRSLALQAEAGVPNTQAGGGLTVGQNAQAAEKGNEVRKQVISFGEQFNSASPTFGWVIQPQQLGMDGIDYIQRASQTSLAALISLPAWREEIRVKVKRSWTDQSGGPENSIAEGQEFTIELPVNFETIDASLFETNDRSPSIYEWAAEGITVRPCERVEFVIPGRRLWRSTVVTLGSQKADEIFVLPDMNGIYLCSRI
jgi:hypothetical protein